jgi:hypothetical protein
MFILSVFKVYLNLFIFHVHFFGGIPVVTITLPAHTGDHMALGLELAVIVGAILTAIIRMVEQASGRLPIRRVFGYYATLYSFM